MIRNKAHLIGICGTGMSALAVLLKEAGWQITGSDSSPYEPVLGYLQKNKIPFYKNYKAKNIPKDVRLAIIGRHVGLSPKENAETREAIKRGMKIKSFPEMLSLISAKTDNLIVVGSYGKSSVTALISWCLKKAKKDPSYFIGAIPVDFKNSSHLGKGKAFVLEGDEYPSSNWDNTSKFLHLKPSSVLLISAEHDHANIFPTEKSYTATYKKLVTKIPKDGFLVYSKDGKNTEEIAKYAKGKSVSYSLNNEKALWYTKNIKYGGVTSFDLVRRGLKITNIRTRLLGNHNIENIVGAGALLLESKKIKPSDFARAVYSFHGIMRRLELKNKNALVPVYEDFGSSYRKAKAGLDALRLHYPGRRIITVFEPHSFSWRNKKFLKWYKTIFNGANEVVLLPAPSHGKKTHNQLTFKEIWSEAKKHARIHKATTEKEALSILKNIVRKDDIIILISSGSLLGLSKSVPRLIERLF